MKKAILVGTIFASLATAFAGANVNAQNDPPLPWNSEIVPITPTTNLA